MNQVHTEHRHKQKYTPSAVDGFFSDVINAVSCRDVVQSGKNSNGIEI